VPPQTKNTRARRGAHVQCSLPFNHPEAAANRAAEEGYRAD